MKGARITWLIPYYIENGILKIFNIKYYIVSSFLTIKKTRNLKQKLTIKLEGKNEKTLILYTTEVRVGGTHTTEGFQGIYR